MIRIELIKRKLVIKMKTICKIIILVSVLFCSLNKTLSYYNTSNNLINNFFTEKYNLTINGTGGTFNDKTITVKNNTVVLPKPEKNGYQFVSYTDKNNISYSTNINDVGLINNQTLSAKWNLISYSINYNLNGGTLSPSEIINSYNVENTITLPTPNKTGYTFIGWTGTGLSSATKNVIIKNGIGNRSYTANWSKNYYTVNYYVNNSLWQQRSVGYNDNLENLNAQSTLDNYHTFHGWTGWVNNMPSYNVNLYANITESYCQLTTGHGPYGNASALLNVFRSAGWTGTIIEAATSPGNYMVVTDYNLTRAQAEIQKNYIASHTNYNNYNYPYLYWVAVTCTNGYSEAWTRGKGQANFN